jgi:hypothetical protein
MTEFPTTGQALLKLEKTLRRIRASELKEMALFHKGGVSPQLLELAKEIEQE